MGADSDGVVSSSESPALVVGEKSGTGVIVPKWPTVSGG